MQNLNEQQKALLERANMADLYNATPDQFKSMILEQAERTVKLLEANEELNKQVKNKTSKAPRTKKETIHTNGPRKAVKELINALRKVGFYMKNQELYADDNIKNAVELWVATFNSGHAESKKESRNLGEQVGWKIDKDQKLELRSLLNKILVNETNENLFVKVPYLVPADTNNNAKEKREQVVEVIEEQEAEDMVPDENEVADAVLVDTKSIVVSEERQLELPF